MQLAKEAGFKTESSEDVRKMFQQGGLSGWGRIEVVEFDFAKKLARVRWTNGVDVRNSKGKTPVCHFVRGLLMGATEALFGNPCESLEISCQGKGGGADGCVKESSRRTLGYIYHARESTSLKYQRQQNMSFTSPVT